LETLSSSAQEEILRAAVSLFSKKGYAGTGVQEILDEVGLSKPTLYYHFESKAGLFRALLNNAYDETYRLMRSAVDAAENMEGKLVAAADALFQFTLANQDLTRLMFATVFANSEEIPPEVLNNSKRRRNQEVVEEVLREGQRTGQILARYELRDFTHAIFGAVSHRIRTFLLTGEGELTRETAEKIVRLFLEGARKRTK
jgi:AcrR family transcriptional regulator